MQLGELNSVFPDETSPVSKDIFSNSKIKSSEPSQSTASSAETGEHCTDQVESVDLSRETFPQPICEASLSNESNSEIDTPAEPNTRDAIPTDSNIGTAIRIQSSTEATNLTQSSTEVSNPTQSSTEVSNPAQSSTEDTNPTQLSTEATNPTQSSTEASNPTQPSTEATSPTKFKTEAAIPIQSIDEAVNTVSLSLVGIHPVETSPLDHLPSPLVAPVHSLSPPHPSSHAHQLSPPRSAPGSTDSEEKDLKVSPPSRIPSRKNSPSVSITEDLRKLENRLERYISKV